MWFIRVRFFDFAQSVAADRAKAAERLAEMAASRGVARRTARPRRPSSTPAAKTVRRLPPQRLRADARRVAAARDGLFDGGFLAQCGGSTRVPRREGQGDLSCRPRPRNARHSGLRNDPASTTRTSTTNVLAHFTLLNHGPAPAPPPNTFQLRRNPSAASPVSAPITSGLPLRRR